jgi:hypothetical protein
VNVGATGVKAGQVFVCSNLDSGLEVEKSLLEAAEAVTRADLASTRREERSPKRMIAAIM